METERPFSVLVVDDEENLRHLLRVILEREGLSVHEAVDGKAALALLEAQPDTALVLCDIRMPNMDGLSFLSALKERGAEVPVVMMSAYGSTDTAIAALELGAFDYIAKPFRAGEIRACVERVQERADLRAENLRLRTHVERGPGGFLGASPAARAVLDLVRQVADYPTTVLVTGESGTGKELVARALHECSGRSGGPFLPVNCAAIPENLLESELFGHERGAFTGAVRAHPGMFERADGGTLLLDEIGDMAIQLQTRLLRVLEDGRVRRLGGTKDKLVEVRVVAATAKDLEAAVESGAFREDLYYRLNVVRIAIPPLRERVEDIGLLVDHFVRDTAERLGRKIAGVEAEARACLLAHPWPGNVRQLENAIERSVLVARGTSIALCDLPQEVRDGQGALSPASAVPSLGEDLSIKRHTKLMEKALIEEALRRTGGNRTQAALLLELSTKALTYKIRNYAIEA
jgi:two-component system response regulator AtoC